MGSTAHEPFDSRVLLDAVAVPVFAIDPEGRIAYANAAAGRFFGWPAASLQGKPAAELLPERSRAQEARATLAQAAAHRRVDLLRRDGSEMSMAASVATAGLLLVVSLRPMVEERRGEEPYRLVFDNAPVGLLRWDANGVVTDCNPAIVQILGSSRERVIGLNLLSLHGESSREQVAALVRGTLRGEPGRFEGAYTSTAQKTSYLTALLAPLQEPGGAQGGVAIIEDVTERKRIQAALARADRMVSIGTLAAGVAHEINNPLVYVTLGLELIDRDLTKLRSRTQPPGESEWEELRTLCADALQGAERVRSIVRDLHTFSRADDQASAPVDVQKVLDASINVAMSHIRPRARLVREYQPLLSVAGDESRLGQVFLNLLVNAAQAIPEGAPEKNTIVVRTRTGPRREAVVEVEDTGIGIEPWKMKSIFEPFWTDKPVGVGTGLGLSIVHSIVSALGGDIQVRSEPGHGSTFQVTLPSQSSPPPPAPRPAAAPAMKPGHRPRVLLIDDEAHLGMTLTVGLREQADVVAVRSGRDAVRILSGDPAFDLILCDLMMPDITGVDVFEEVNRANPELRGKFVFMTGGAVTERARRFLDEIAGQRLDKPFRLEQVEGLLRRRATS